MASFFVLRRWTRRARRCRVERGGLTTASPGRPNRLRSPNVGEQVPERLVFFADAAIAITLLVLPLVDAVPGAVAQHLDPAELISENQKKIYSFLLSFAVIARLWVAHHHVFEQVKSYSRPLMVANFGWVLMNA